MASSLAARLAFVPAGLALVLLARECGDVYRKIYTVSKYAAFRRGVRFGEGGGEAGGEAAAAAASSSPARLARALAPPAAGAAAGAVTLVVARAALERVLLARVTPAARTRLFDAALPPAARAAARPTLARVWALVGPATATRATWRELGRAHGLALTALALATLWAVCVAPLAHAHVEARLAQQRMPRLTVSEDGGDTG